MHLTVCMALGRRRCLHKVDGSERSTCCLIDHGFRNGGGAQKVVFGYRLIKSRFHRSR